MLASDERPSGNLMRSATLSFFSEEAVKGYAKLKEAAYQYERPEYDVRNRLQSRLFKQLCTSGEMLCSEVKCQSLATGLLIAAQLVNELNERGL